MNKPQLRRQLRAARDEFAASEGAIEAPSLFTGRLGAGMLVATYRPIGSEADPVSFDLAVLAALGELALPHLTDRETAMRFLHWPRHADLVRGPFGLWQMPDDAAPAVAPDIILTPLVGFDRRGNRLGQGAGHYDRAFAAHPTAWRVGVAFSVQEVNRLPIDPWDMPLHAIITEKEWITPT